MAIPSTYERQSALTGDGAIFAAQSINLRSQADKQELIDNLAAARAKSRQAWKFYEKLGVIRYPLNRAARLAGAATLHAVMLDDQGRRIGPIGDDDKQLAPAIEVVKSMYSRLGGVRGLIERYMLLMKVTADATLIRVKESGVPDGFMFLSPDEMQTDADGVPGNKATLSEVTWVTRRGGRGGGAMTRKVAQTDVLGRVWQPSPRFVADSDPVLSTLAVDCDLLYRTQIVLAASMRSRAALAGFLFFPNTMDKLAAGKIKGTGPEDMVNKVNDIISMNMELNEAGDAADIAHIVISGDPDDGAKIREITLGAETREADLKLAEVLFDRIMFALDINVKSTTGETDTRYDSWNATSDELRLAVQPDLEAMCWSLTRLVLYPELKKAGLTDAQIAHTAVWYDLSEAAVKINLQEDARQLADRGGLSLKAARRVAGFPESDAPTTEEYVREFGFKKGNAYTAFYGLDLPPDFDMEKAMQTGAGRPSNPGEDPSPDPGVGDNPGSPGSDEN